MKFVNRYLECIYVDGGRTDTEMDCWQMVRTVRHKELGMRELPSYGHLRNDNPRDFTRAYIEQAAFMEPCEPEHGAIASVMHGKVCVHVAVVLEHEGRLRILEINPVRGPRFMLLADWLKDHLTVTYHRDIK
jgi:hypothetical protein